jgi:hypothetical protein
MAELRVITIAVNSMPIRVPATPSLQVKPAAITEATPPRPPCAFLRTSETCPLLP